MTSCYATLPNTHSQAGRCRRRALLVQRHTQPHYTIPRQPILRACIHSDGKELLSEWRLKPPCACLSTGSPADQGDDTLLRPDRHPPKPTATYSAADPFPGQLSTWTDLECWQSTSAYLRSTRCCCCSSGQPDEHTQQSCRRAGAGERRGRADRQTYSAPRKPSGKVHVLSASAGHARILPCGSVPAGRCGTGSWSAAVMIKLGWKINLVQVPRKPRQLGLGAPARARGDGRTRGLTPFPGRLGAWTDPEWPQPTSADLRSTQHA